ncbi:calcium-binding protein, partial [Microvirga arsenatis]
TSPAQLARLHWNGSKLAAGTIANALLHQGDTRALIENATGGSGSDSIVGNQAGNSLAGNAGDDRLTGGLGDDVLNGGAGTDTAVFGSRRSDYSVTLLADGSLQILDLRAGGSDGRDIVWATELFQFSDRLYSLAELTSTDEPATPDEPAADEDLVLTGTGAAESLYGADGDDLINGQAGDDSLYGLDGDDILTGGAGRDRLDGGAGKDTASYATASSAVLADLASPSRNTRDAYRDTYVGIENLTGSAYADSLRGNDSANDILGGAGSDTLFGRGGNDLLEGGEGNDSLDGGSASDSLDAGAGRDTLYGGTGADTLDGGTGVDIFVFKTVTETAPGAQDIIANFVSGTDKIDLRSIDANTKLSRNQAFSFIGEDTFNGRAGELRFSGGILSGDVNGDGTADFKIGLPDTSLLRATDFYL